MSGATAPNLPPARGYLLKRTEDGKAELFADGLTLWSSDTDPDLLEALGTDAVRNDDIGDVLNYLVDAGHLSEAEADDHCVVDSPEDEDETPPGDDEDEDDDDWDEDDEPEDDDDLE